MALFYYLGCFEEISCRYFCLLLSVMELDVTSLVALEHVKTQQQCLSPEIKIRFLKKIYSFCCEKFHAGTSLSLYRHTEGNPDLIIEERLAN